MSATKRKISKDLWEKLTQGEYKEIIEFASKRENDLDVQIRDNYLNIYYRGGNLLKLQPRSMSFDEFYFHTNVAEIRKTHILEYAKAGDSHYIDLWGDYKRERDKMLNILKEKGGMPIYCKKMKALMDAWESALNTMGGISHDEKNAQQNISMNNRGGTPYTVIDVEYAVSRNSPFSYNGKLGKKIPRFDIIAVDNTGQLYVVELKTGLGSIGGTSGIREHIDCFNHTIGRDKEGEFISEMKDLLEQKRNLKLIDKRIKIDENKKPQFIFAFSDKEGENQYHAFVEACRKRNYDGKIIYLDNSYCLKDLL